MRYVERRRAVLTDAETATLPPSTTESTWKTALDKSFDKKIRDVPPACGRRDRSTSQTRPAVRICGCRTQTSCHGFTIHEQARHPKTGLFAGALCSDEFRTEFPPANFASPACRESEVRTTGSCPADRNFAGHRGGYDIKLVKPDDAVDRPRTRDVCRSTHIIEYVGIVLDGF